MEEGRKNEMMRHLFLWERFGRMSEEEEVIKCEIEKWRSSRFFFLIKKVNQSCFFKVTVWIKISFRWPEEEISYVSLICNQVIDPWVCMNCTDKQLIYCLALPVVYVNDLRSTPMTFLWIIIFTLSWSHTIRTWNKTCSIIALFFLFLNY